MTFEEWIRPYLDRAYRTAAAVTGERQAAHDAVQEALLRAYLARDRFRDGAPVWPWLRRIVVHEALRLGRREAAYTPSPEDWEEWEAPPDQGPSERVEAWETRSRVWAALTRLERGLRAAVVLHHLLDVPVREVATVLGVPAGTAKWLLHEARVRLRADLADLADALPRAVKGVTAAMSISAETMESLVAAMSPYRTVGWLLPERVRTARRLVLLWWWDLCAADSGRVEDAFGRVPALSALPRDPHAFAEARRLWTERYNDRPPRTTAEADALDRLYYGAAVQGHGVSDPDGTITRRLAEEDARLQGQVHPDVREAFAALRARGKDRPTVALLSPADVFQVRECAGRGLLEVADAVAPTSKDFGMRTSHTAEEAAERYRELAEAFGAAVADTTVVASAEWYAPYLVGIGLAGMHAVLQDRNGIANTDRGREHLAQVGWGGPLLSDLRTLPELIR